MSKLSFLLIAFLFIASSAQAQTLESKAVSGIDASGDDFVYYNLENGRIVTEAEVGFGGWDIAFQGTDIKVNGSSRFINVKYDDVLEAAEDEYAQSEDGFSQLPGGSGSGWFVYDPNSHMISPVANKTILIQNAAGLFAKIEITDYYKTVFNDDGPAPKPRHYSFRYTLQKDGSRNFQSSKAVKLQ